MARVTIYRKEIYEKVNKDNKVLLEDYILEMKSKRRSAGTIYQYTADIKMFYCYVYEFMKNKSILDLKKRDFRNFFLFMQEKDLSPARINRVQCSVRNLLEFASDDEDEYDYEQNVMSKIKGLPKEEVREIVFLEDGQVDKIYDYLIEKGQYQKACYLRLAYDSAGRRNEIVQVEKDGLLERNQTNIVTGKRNKKFPLFYFSKSKDAIKQWLEVRGDDDVPELFIASKGGQVRPASYELLYVWSKEFADIISDIEGRRIEMNAHSLRHSALENISNGTHYVLKELGKDVLDLNTLRVYAHHTSVDTTQGYLKNRDDELLANTFNI